MKIGTEMLLEKYKRDPNLIAEALLSNHLSKDQRYFADEIIDSDFLFSYLYRKNEALNKKVESLGLEVNKLKSRRRLK